MRFLLLAALAPSLAFAMTYPPSPTSNTVDDYHGTPVADPYRPLEDVDAPATLEWVKAQNAVSLPFLAQLPAREAMKTRMTELWNYERFEVPVKASGKLFFRKNNGLQNQSVLYVQDSPEAAPRLLLDPNTLSADGTVALSQWEVSPDGRWLGYAIAASGSDWNEFRVLSVETGAQATDVLSRIKFSGLSWTADSQGFFYSRYPEAPTKKADETFDDLANQKIYYHRLGQPQAQDVLVHEFPKQPKWSLYGTVTQDGRWLVMSAVTGTGAQNAVFVKDLGDAQKPKLDGAVIPVVSEFESAYTSVTSVGDELYLFTNNQAPLGRVIRVNLKKPTQRSTVIPEGRDTLQHVLRSGQELVAVTMHDATTRLTRYSLAGKKLGDIALDGLGSIPAPGNAPQISGSAKHSDLYFAYASYSRPATNYHVDLATGKSRVLHPLTLGFSPSDYVTEQVFFTSKDGTRVPMFVSHKKGLKRDAKTPTMLYGYGGFDIPMTPSFAVQNLVWMEAGGILAVANLRGGGEYGRAWHEAGTKAKKQNVFDDFTAAAGYLTSNGYTSSKNLCIQGRSNGGLLVGATLNQHPDLFSCALPGVGVMDMLRYHKFTIGWAWAEDYGTSDTKEGFDYLIKYSPVHQAKPGTKYPAVLVTTADHDDRVVPGHSFKYAAAMQAAQAGDAPVLIRIDVKAGHGAGKPLSKTIDEFADMYAFAWHYTGGQ